MAQMKNTDLLTVALDFNGKRDLSEIYREMTKMYDQVAPAYKGKVNRTETDIRYSLRKANEVIYREARLKAPKVRPDIQARQNKELQLIHLSDKKYMIEGARQGKTWRKQGIVARRVVTFKAPVGEYAAAVEYGRKEFMQVIENKSYKKKNGDTNFHLRAVGAMKAQPFLRKAQNSKAQSAFDTFSAVLDKRWNTTMKTVAKHHAKEAEG
jgi:hypothetical protein